MFNFIRCACIIGFFVATPVSAQVINYELSAVMASGLAEQPQSVVQAQAAALSRSSPVDLDARERVVERQAAGYQPVQPHVGPISKPIVAGSVARLQARRPAYGPFRVWSDTHAVLVGETTTQTPAQFAQMLRDYPKIAMIEMIDCPGTQDDIANMRLGRMIRERGISTHVPRGGSVRSGGVELFIAGTRRYLDLGAEFAVHSWMDTAGRQARDYAFNSPENKRYIDYYKEMGMPAQKAVAFYNMTNAVPYASARWFGAQEMERWVNVIRSGNRSRI